MITSNTTTTTTAASGRGGRSASGNDAQEPMAQLLAALASDRPIGYSPNLARVAGDPKAGLLLSQLLYWTRVGVDVESSGGWITKSREQWTHETGLSRCEQESARTLLLDAGLIEECRTGMPAKLAFRLRLGQLSAALAALLNEQPVQWSLFDVRSNADQVRALLGRSMAFYRVYSEITGSVVQAIFMARAVQAQRALLNGPSGGRSDWFAFSPGAWALETGLTAAQLRSSKQKLCQSAFVEQAMMQYPKRRTVLRMRLSELTAAILEQRLARMNDGRSVGGLLGAIGRTHTENTDTRGGRAKVLVSAATPPIITPAKSHQQGNRMDSASIEGGSPLWRTVIQDDASPLWRTTEEIPQKPSDQASLQDSSVLDGGISQVKGSALSPAPAQATPLTCENPQASFNASDGGFSQISRQVLAGLHAGARCLTTTLNKTPPPTPSPIPIVSSLSSVEGGGGGVVLNQRQENRVDASAATDLVWPDLEPAALVAIQRMVGEDRRAKSLSLDRLQLVLDELAAMVARGVVRVPSSYFGRLLSQDCAGTLDLAAAYEWQARRALNPSTSSPILVKQKAIEASIAKTCQLASQPVQPVAPIDPRAQAIWTLCLEALQTRIQSNHLALWLNPLSPVAWTDQSDDQSGRLVLLCGSRFKLDHIKTTYLGQINGALTEIMSARQTLSSGWTCQLVTSWLCS